MRKNIFVKDRIILPLMHPVTLLNNPEIEKEMKKDYKKLMTLLDGLITLSIILLGNFLM